MKIKEIKLSVLQGILVLVGFICLFIALVFSVTSLGIERANNQITPVPTITPIPTISVSITPTPTSTLEADAKEILRKKGWEDKDVKIGDDQVNIKKDESKSGSLSFSSKKIQTREGMISFLLSNNVKAKVSLESLIKDTKTNAKKVKNLSNWVVLQSEIDFTYPGNTAYKNGQAIDVGPRDGGKGDIFFLFVDPDTKLFKFYRGACSNGQGYTPEAKSSDPADYKVPVKNKKAKVENLLPGAPAIVINPMPTAKPGSIAPGAIGPNNSPRPTTAPNNTPTPTPPPDVGANPTGGPSVTPAKNSGDPGGWG